MGLDAVIVAIPLDTWTATVFTSAIVFNRLDITLSQALHVNPDNCSFVVCSIFHDKFITRYGQV